MDKIETLIQQLSELPKGYISKKTIKGKTYFYWQYLENGKLKSKYIHRDELEGLQEALKKRAKLEQELKEAKAGARELPNLSSRAKSFTGCLMVGDKVAAKFKDGSLIDIDEGICPLYVKRTGNIEKFIEGRCLDLSRPNARVLLKFLGITNKSESLIPLYSYGACISDNYWFKPSGSKKTYEDIRFDNDFYSNIALNGGIPQLKSFGSPSPELTNIGSFEKCWKLIDGEWWMYKKGDEDQIFSELFSSRLAAKLGIPTAIYEYDKGNVRTKNFASNYNFEPTYALCEDEEDYETVFEILKGLNEEIAKAYLLLLFFDCIVYNVDRHNNNYGVLRNKDNGAIVSLAPNFDNNLSLLSYNKILDQSPKTDALIKMFTDFLKKRPDALKLFKTAEVNQITKEDVTNTFKEIPIQRDEDKIVHFIMSRYEHLMGIKKS